MKRETENDKAKRMWDNFEKLKEISTISYITVGQTRYTVYNIMNLVNIKISNGNVYKIVEFDKDHRVEIYDSGAPKFVGPTSNMWDGETTDMFYNFVDNVLHNLDDITKIFIF